jgi:hypothetical protein
MRVMQFNPKFAAATTTRTTNRGLLKLEEFVSHKAHHQTGLSNGCITQ